MEKIKYKKIKQGKYKYELTESYSIQTEILKACHIAKYIYLTATGSLLICKKYRWDGCSGPTIDDPTNQRAGLVHDSIYQLMAEGLLSDGWRAYADRLFFKILREDGMPYWRAQYYWLGVRLAGWKFV